jgi:hypothetical protein
LSPGNQRKSKKDQKISKPKSKSKSMSKKKKNQKKEKETTTWFMASLPIIMATYTLSREYSTAY